MQQLQPLPHNFSTPPHSQFLPSQIRYEQLKEQATTIDFSDHSTQKSQFSQHPDMNYLFHTPQHFGPRSKPAEEAHLLVDWINSFNDPYCLLVNSLQDLADGIALCHLVGFVTCSPADQAKMRQLIYYSIEQESLSLVASNFELALNVLKSSALPVPESLRQLTTQDLQTNERSLVLVLETLKTMQDLLRAQAPNIRGQMFDSHCKGFAYQELDEVVTQADESQIARNQLKSSHSGSPRNLPLQQRKGSLPRQEEKNLDIANISPINEKNHWRDSGPSQQEEFLQLQEQKICEELSRLSNSNVRQRNALESFTPQHFQQQQKSRFHSSDQSTNNDVSQTSFRKQSGKKKQEKQRIAQRQQENQNYQVLLQKSYKKMSQSKTRDPLLYEKSASRQRASEQEECPQEMHIEEQLSEQQFQPKKEEVDCEEMEVMSQMQTLHIRPQALEEEEDDNILVQEVDLKTKQKVLDWLCQEVKLIKGNSERLISEFPQYCRNGVLLFDLVNRLGGKHDILKGVERNPRNLTSVSQNFKKMLEHFRQFQRFNPRYLWARKLLMEGSEDVVWGLLDDIWHWHHNKISPFDPTNKKEASPVPKSQKKSHLIKKFQELPPRKDLRKDVSPVVVRHSVQNLSVREKPSAQKVQLPVNLTYSNMKSPRTGEQSELNSLRRRPASSQADQQRSVEKKGERSVQRKGQKQKSGNTPIGKDFQGNVYFLNEKRDKHGYFSFLERDNTYKDKLLFVTDEMKGEINEWLFRIKFQQFLSKEHLHQGVTSDPVRNGLLLSELVCHLENVELLNLHLKPSTLKECRSNLVQVLSVLRQRRSNFPALLASEETIESLMKRDPQTLYQLLHFLKDLSPEPRPFLKQLSLQNLQDVREQLALPYSSQELEMLELSLINWIASFGLFQKLEIGGNKEIESFMQFQKQLSNGTLLCEVVQTLFKVKLSGGFFRDPKTDSTAQSNIRKSLEFLRTQGRMSQKFTWAEKEVFEGKLQVCLGLFEDLHRFFDGMPPRKRGLHYFSDGPYFGSSLYSNQPQPRRSHNFLRSSTVQSTQQTKEEEQDESKIGAKIQFTEMNKLNQYEDVPSIFNNLRKEPVKESLQTFSPTSVHNIQATQSQSSVGKVNFGNFLSAKMTREQESYRSPQREGSNTARTLENKENQNTNRSVYQLPVQAKPNIVLSCLQTTNTHSSLPNSTSPSSMLVPPTRSPLSIESRGRLVEFEGKDHIRKPSQTISIEEYEDEQHQSNRHLFNEKEKRKIVEWLHLLQVDGVSEDFNLNKESIPEFRDGVLICEIVEVLEGVKISNVQSRAKSTASCLLNIKKALQLLKKKNQIPLYLIYSEEEIHNGNPDIIFQLLKSLRQVYRHKTASLEQQLQQKQRKKNGF